MAKPTFKTNPRTQQVLEDLDQYREFCQDFGYRWNEADLYNFRSYAFQQFNKFAQGKTAKNQWDEDARRFAGYRHS
jgi:hypothetical protein